MATAFEPNYSTFAPVYKTPGYHAQDAYAMGLASTLSYEKDPAKVDEILRSWGFSRTHIFSRTRGKTIDTQGFVGIGDTEILVAFRGSESKADWLTNLQANTDPGGFQSSEVHSGFRDALFPVLLELGAILGQEHKSSASGPSKTLWVTGHSLGGALATLFMALLTVADGDCAGLVDFSFGGLYTFGAPRVGDRRFAQSLEACPLLENRIFRVLNFGDPVPQLPRRYMGFRHGGQAITINVKGEVLESAPPPPSRLKAFGEWLRYVAQPDFQSLESHLMPGENGYLQALQRAIVVSSS